MGAEWNLGKAAIFLKPDMYFGLVDILSQELKEEPGITLSSAMGLDDVEYKNICFRLHAGLKFTPF
jgi:hypothetical protein